MCAHIRPYLAAEFAYVQQVSFISAKSGADHYLRMTPWSPHTSQDVGIDQK